MHKNQEAIVGCLLGTAVGDALGLPYEGVSRQRSLRLLGPPDRHRFFFGRGMISDDTEHSCMVAQSMVEAGRDVDLFAARFATRLRWWILVLPAGVGKATARSCLKLWLGAKPENAGVFSAGNGPSMRAAIFGATIDDIDLMLKFVLASSRLTHTDPKAACGAIVVALAARYSRMSDKISANDWLTQVVESIGEEGAELSDLLRKVVESHEDGQSSVEFAESLGLAKGVTGYTYHTVPIAIHAWLSHPRDYRAAVTSVIQCGGDADTTAAIVGGIVGAGVGRDGIPETWIEGIRDWPRSVTWIEVLAERLAESLESESMSAAPRTNGVSIMIRNMLFLSIVLFHGFRRLAPPY